MVRMNHCPGFHVPLHETHQIVVMFALNLVDYRYVRGPTVQPKTPLDIFRELTLMMPPLPSKLGFIDLTRSWQYKVWFYFCLNVVRECSSE